MFEWLEQAGDFAMSGVMAAMVWTGLAEAPPERIELGPFLAGFEQSCAVGPELEAFWQSLISGEQLAIPDYAKPYFGPLQTHLQDEYRELLVPVKGEWLGYDVDAFAAYAGNDNGIAVMSLFFSPHQDGLMESLGPVARASGAVLDADPENFTGVSTDLVMNGGVAQFYCDFST